MIDLCTTIYYEPTEHPFDEDFFFCGDDLYGRYSKDDLIQLRSALWCRITEVIEKKLKFGEK